ESVLRRCSRFRAGHPAGQLTERAGDFAFPKRQDRARVRRRCQSRLVQFCLGRWRGDEYTHMSAERFRATAGIAAVHMPTKGGPEAMTEVMAGRVDFCPVGLVLPLIREGKLLGLAVNSAKRSPTLPDLPTTLEAGFADSDYPIWFGMFVPAK